jgi:hypothetical protein
MYWGNTSMLVMKEFDTLISNECVTMAVNLMKSSISIGLFWNSFMEIHPSCNFDKSDKAVKRYRDNLTGQGLICHLLNLSLFTNTISIYEWWSKSGLWSWEYRSWLEHMVLLSLIPEIKHVRRWSIDQYLSVKIKPIKWVKAPVLSLKKN